MLLPNLPRAYSRLLIIVSSLILLLTCISFFADTPESVREFASKIPIIGPKRKPDDPKLFKLQYEARDTHPISKLIAEADRKFQEYDQDVSRSFQETLTKYRRKYGRHPPPGFGEWYKFARKRNVHNIDDFEQVMDDLRPFWSVPPAIIRSMAAQMGEEQGKSVTGIHIRNGKVINNKEESWRPDTFIRMIKGFVGKLPDMDIAINTMDQSRVIVKWDTLQQALESEKTSRAQHPETLNSFTEGMTGFWGNPAATNNSVHVDPQWFGAAGKQFMELAHKACPPDSHANDGESQQAAEARWKIIDSGIITNYNLSTDLCTMGPEMKTLHGFMMSSSSMLVTHALVPIFSECKVNVNNDILFPAAMYWRNDKRYTYDASHDWAWDDKKDNFYWRGVTSGGVQLPTNWERMHRTRLVRMLNATRMKDEQPKILAQTSTSGLDYQLIPFHPEAFLSNHSDVALTKATGCFPQDCAFYLENMAMVSTAEFKQQFESKFLLDVDGHSFSGRWRAFLQSKSLGLKATIFREWFDSRMFAWRHFVPVDNRYDDLLSVLTYFIGIQNAADTLTPGYLSVPKHEFEAKRLALQGREWANKVLRNEDIEIYMYRLLLEYGRLIDDNRDRIGYSGDGSEVDNELGIH